MEPQNNLPAYLRAYVTRWDEHHIFAQDPSEAPLEIVYDTTNTHLLGSHSYLSHILSEGTPLNIIHPHSRDGLLLPELIVYHPDFLLDISAIASRFNDFGETPLLALLRRFTSNRPTRHSLLGDFASQLLDEEVHHVHHSYSESISTFFARNALAMATCEDLSSDFHQDALRQKHIIHQAINVDLPRVCPSYNSQEVILEPSFLCEMLGLQGRMDFLQTDFHLLIEQKSGHGMFTGDDNLTYPHATTAHFVQLLLYRALLHYGFAIPDQEIRPFLLYSKYSHALLPTSSAPLLLHRAITLRNLQVHQELTLARSGFDLLDTLTPEDFNPKQLYNKLWTDYTLPDIQETLSPYQLAPDLEKAYAKTFLRFLQREYVLSKSQPSWQLSLKEKTDRGDILYDLSISLSPDGSRVACHNVNIFMSNFRVGDIVILYQYNVLTEPDPRQTIVHRAIIQDITAHELTLSLRDPQTNIKIFHTPEGVAWALEHDSADSSFSPLYRGIYSFLSASPEKKSLFLHGRTPRVDSSLTLTGDYGAFNELQLRVLQAQELFLIVGPPGTGKTSYGMLYTLREELAREGSSVAVMAYTNRAVDEICSRLMEDHIDFTRIGNALACAPAYRHMMWSERLKELHRVDDVRSFLRSQRVVVGTIVAFLSHSSLFTLRSFSLAIVDEASQILEPQILGLISARHEEEEAIHKFVFIGDYKQLPAVTQVPPSEAVVDDPLLNDVGITSCRMSLFERLLHRHEDNPQVTYTLHRQGRMHEDIASLANQLFYGGILSCVPLPHQTAPSVSTRVRFIDVPSPTDSPADTVNIPEAQEVARITSRLDSALSVGIIVPYRNQISAIRQALDSLPDLSLRDITIDTVERFQGSQRDVVIYSFTVQQPYQLSFLTEQTFIEGSLTIDRKLNVVLTRARLYLYLLGSASLLSTVPLFRRLISLSSGGPFRPDLI